MYVLTQLKQDCWSLAALGCQQEGEAVTMGKPPWKVTLVVTDLVTSPS